MPDYKKLLEKLYISFIYYSLFSFLFCLLLFVFQQTDLLQQKNLLNWDAAHYEFIKNYGYEGFRTAFFPLFPFFWKALNVAPIGIAVINGFVFIISISILAYYFEVNLRNQLLLLSVPSLFFMFVPYTESLFFLFGTLLIIGLHRNNIPLIAIGLLFSSMVRPSAYVFIPAIIITEYLTMSSLSLFFKRAAGFSLIIISGLFITILIQYYYTHQWFAFFEAQKGWDNQLRIPKLPLTSWSGDNIVRLDGSALLVGCIALIALLKLAFSHFYYKVKTGLSKAFIFPLLYLTGMSLIVLLFRGGSLYSLNRFIYASPYFIVAFIFFLNQSPSTPIFLLLERSGRGRGNRGEAYMLLLTFSIFWLLFGSYVHIQTFMKYELLAVYLLLAFLVNSNNNKIKTVAYYSFFSVSMILQMYFKFRFLNNQWVG